MEQHLFSRYIHVLCFFILSTGVLAPVANAQGILYGARVPWSSPTALTSVGTDYDRVEPADFDGDGYMDYAVFSPSSMAPSSSGVIVKGAGNGTYGDFFDMGNVASANGDWGDYDNDGDMDLAVVGVISGSRAIGIYRYDRPAQMFTYISITTEGLDSGDLAWVDTDNDGDLDLVVAGSINSNPTPTHLMRLYVNNGNQTFSVVTNAFSTRINNPHVSTGDMNRDGLVDVIMSGTNVLDGSLALFQSRGNNTFKYVRLPLTTGENSTQAAADFDNDGDLDLVVAGPTRFLVSFNVGFNVAGDPVFTNTIDLGLVTSPSLDVADVNQDGKSDVILQGHSSIRGMISEVHFNYGATGFIGEETTLNKLRFGNLRFTYSDSDTKLDIVQTGKFASSSTSNSYSYLGTYGTLGPNAVPTAPSTGFSFTQINCTTSRLYWGHATDDITPANALRYNIRIGTSPGAQNIRAAMANLTTGRRFHMSNGLIPMPTNGLPLNNLAPGIYYYSVQAVDANGLGGAWSTERSFTVQSYPSTTLQSSYTVVSGDQLNIDATLAYSGSINYTVVRPTVAGIANAGITQISPQVNERLFNTTASPVVVNYQFTALLAGCTYTTTVPVTVQPMVQTLAAPSVFGDRSDHVWADFDRDGDLDIFIIGSTTTGARAEIWLNNGSGQLTVLPNHGIQGLGSASADVGDIDNDGWPDIVANGAPNAGGARTQVWRNNRNNTFTEIANTITGTHT